MSVTPLRFTNSSSFKALSFLLLLCLQFTYSQNANDSIFISKVDQILKLKPDNYVALDSVLWSYQKDSLKMFSLKDKSKQENYALGEGYASNALGIINRDISNYETAIDFHKQAESLAKSVDNIELQVISLNMIGVVYRRMDVIKPALDYHTKALNLAESTKDRTKNLKRSIAVSQNSMGNIYLALKQWDLAISQFDKSLAIELEEDNKLGLAINYHNIGYAEEAKGNLEKALTNYRRSLGYNNIIDSDLGRVICDNSIGKVYIKQEKYEEARPLIEEALEKALKIGDKFYIASSYINLGWLEKELGLLNGAKEHLSLGMETATNFNLRSSIVLANQHLSDLYTMQGDHKLAMHHYKLATEMDNTITNERNLQYANDVIIEYQNESKNREIKALADENEIVRSKLEKNKRIFLFAMLGLILIATLIIVFNRNEKLQKEKQILTLEQDMLRNQMNPHFIFNSLNSIKLYIINNEKENAVYYLNKFAKLIRKILVATTEKDISLEEELETMQLYMNIENIRFSNAIDFNVVIDENIQTATIKVPSLILQPFLENALWHGLSSKAEDKRIALHVSKPDQEYISISITDNGIGRQESERINQAKLLKRKSVGIDLTKARLANFSKDYAGDYKLNIEDLFDGNGKACGTKVVVIIPIQQHTLKTA
ncbi:tetratricopeptide repeat protein [Winogradskyella sp. 3972H.M.0a.05]|uniref:tetratricopeptide repeat-containing sensor histidine kinase n=1 Tax=Winogradskyella sp. 3972H.M.0a.05 TaxID=2950277 RepID=UPI0033995D93